MFNTNQTFALALNHLQSGNLSQAEELLGQILRTNPSHADALHFLGVIAYQRGENDKAIDLMERSLARNKANAIFHNNLGEAYRAGKKLAAAAASFRQALRLQPKLAEAHNNLGLTLFEMGDAQQATASFQKALRLNPDYPEAHNNLGNVRKQQGDCTGAEACYRQALRLQPSMIEACNNLGNVLKEQGQREEAVRCYQRALQLHPGYVDAHVHLGHTFLELERLPEARMSFQQALRLQPDNVSATNGLGNVSKKQGLAAEAEASYRKALQLSPEYAEAHYNLGILLLERDRTREAAASFQQAIALKPDLAAAHVNLGIALMKQDDLDRAVEQFEEALRLEPDHAEAYNNFGIALSKQGRTAAAVDAYRAALRIKPDYPLAHANLLSCLNNDPRLEPAALFAEHKRWGERYGPKLPIPPHANDPDPRRRLRVGYVSPDLRRHSVAYFFEPILAHHDPSQVETICYAEVRAPDAMTQRLQELAHGWRSTCDQSDEAVAQRIRADGIDILVDLAGHTAGSRLRVFALKPAPVQVTYLGYPNTTGLTTVDYRLTDDVTDPPGAPALHTEELVRLPGGFCCYQPPADAPPVAPLPALATGRLTFGAIHNLAKINQDVIDLWCALLRALPSSRLILFRNVLKGKAAEFFQRQFAQQGIAGDRVQLLSEAPGGRVLNLYSEFDLFLDTFPWGGHTTTYEALWMGVPVLTLHGNRHAGRWASGVLTRLDLTEFVAGTPEEYVASAVRLAGALDRLARLRCRLRDVLRASPLCAGPAFARRLEEAYRAMWRSWCARHEKA